MHHIIRSDQAFQLLGHQTTYCRIVGYMRYIILAFYTSDVLSGSKTGGKKAPAIHVHLINYSHRSLMHAVATHVNYFNAIFNNI